MHPSLIYGAVVGIAMTLLLLLHVLRSLSNVLESPTVTGWLFRYVYPRLWHGAAPTRLDVGVQALYWAGSILYNVLGVQTLQDGSARAISLASLNTIPLMFVDQLESMAYLLGMRIRTWQSIHSSIGVMTVVQTSVHFVLFILQHGLDLAKTTDIFVLSLTIVSATFLVGFIPFIKTSCYEVALIVHSMLACGLVFCLWVGLGLHQLTQPHLFLMIACGLFVVSKLFRLLRVVWYSYSFRKGFSRGTIVKLQGATRLKIIPTQPMTIRAGQYVYIWAPGVSFMSFFQSHPFAVAWWTEDVNGRAVSLELVAKTCYGFTKFLERLSEFDHFTVGLDGPYGNVPEMQKYGTLILFATGIGMVAQTAVLKQVMNDYKACKTSVRRVSVHWQMDNEFEEQWIRDWMDNILDLDTTKMLTSKRYVNVSEKSDRHGVEVIEGERVLKAFYKLEVRSVLEQELMYTRGKALIIAAVQPEYREQLRQMSQYLDFGKSDYTELDFQPRTSRKRLWNRIFIKSGE